MSELISIGGEVEMDLSEFVKKDDLDRLIENGVEQHAWDYVYQEVEDAVECVNFQEDDADQWARGRLEELTRRVRDSSDLCGLGDAAVEAIQAVVNSRITLPDITASIEELVKAEVKTQLSRLATLLYESTE